MRNVKGLVLVVMLIVPLALNSCRGERMRIHEAPLYGSGAPSAQQSQLVPGQQIEQRPPLNLETSEAVVIEGRRLYNWYNCSGCHFNGGGGIGPPLMDDEWIYGSEPVNVADSIINGRPQGMPSFGGKIPAAHIAPIVVYVRSLSGLGTGEPTPTPLPSKQKAEKSSTEPAGRQEGGQRR